MMTVRDTRPPVKQEGRAILQTKVWEDHMETMLRDMYTSVKANQILQPIQPGARKNGYLKRRMGSIRKSMRNSMLFNSNPELNHQVCSKIGQIDDLTGVITLASVHRQEMSCKLRLLHILQVLQLLQMLYLLHQIPLLK